MAFLVLVTFALLGGSAFGIVSGDDGGETVLSECQTITESGVYVLNGNLTGGDEDCLVIESDDVVVDGSGNEIAVESDSVSPIKREGDRTNVTVKNLVVDGGAYGIDFDSVQNGEIRNVTITNSLNAIKTHGYDVRSSDVSLVDVEAR